MSDRKEEEEEEEERQPTIILLQRVHKQGEIVCVRSQCMKMYQARQHPNETSLPYEDHSIRQWQRQHPKITKRKSINGVIDCSDFAVICH